jgi:hypothetical protein
MAGKLSGSAIQTGTITSTQLSTELGPVSSELQLVGSGVSLNVSNNAVFSGNIAIGVSSPLAKTHIIPKAAFSTAYNNYDGDALFIDDANANTGAGNYGGAISWSRLSNPPSRKAAIAIFQDTADINQNGLAFFVSPGASSSDPIEEAVRISSSKNVGIGTSLPSQKLHVSGNTYISGNVGIGTESPAYKLDVERSGSGFVARMGTALNVKLHVYTDSGSAYLSSDLSLNNSVQLVNSSNLVLFNTNGSERARITSDGNLGIGTTNPSTRLHVQGGPATLNGGAILYGYHQVVAGDYTTTPTPAYKITSVGSGTYWRATHLSENSTISGVYNYETTKDVYWGEDTDTGNYFFRGRNVEITDGRLIVTNQPLVTLSQNATVSGPITNEKLTSFDVRINVGSHWNAANARFTCPVSGRYEVTAMGIKNPQAGAGHLDLYLNGGGNGAEWRWRMEEAAGYNQFGGSVILSLSAGDYLEFWYFGDAGIHSSHGLYTIRLIG